MAPWIPTSTCQPSLIHSLNNNSLPHTTDSFLPTLQSYSEAGPTQQTFVSKLPMNHQQSQWLQAGLSKTLAAVVVQSTTHTGDNGDTHQPQCNVPHCPDSATTLPCAGPKPKLAQCHTQLLVEAGDKCTRNARPTVMSNNIKTALSHLPHLLGAQLLPVVYSRCIATHTAVCENTYMLLYVVPQ